MMKFLLGIVVLIGVGGAVLFSQLDSVIKSGVESAGPDFLSVDVSVGHVSISPFSGKIEVTDFSVGQPDGFGDGPMVQLGEFKMKVETNTLLDDHVIVDEIVFDQPMFDARMIGSQSNFQALQEKLAAGAGDETIGGEAITLTIRRMVVKSPQISVQKDGLLSVDENIELADFTLSDLGTDEKGLSPKEIARHLMDTLQPQITKALISAGASDKIKDIAKDARGELEEKAGSLLKKLRKKN